MTADEKMLFDTAAFIARTMPDSPTIIVDRTAILSAAAVIERAGDVEGMAKIIHHWVSSTFMDTGDPLDGPRMIARTVSRFILEGK